MNNQTKYKNIIIEEDAENISAQIHKVTSKNTNNKDNAIVNENVKIICSCGKLGTKECIFKACKNCCKNEHCKKHNFENKELIPKKCVFCNIKTIFKSGKIYFCEACYNSNMKLIDNISPKNYMFEITKSDKCNCGLTAPTSCIFNSCRKCCPSKFCSRHNKDVKLLGQFNCSICSKLYNHNLMNSFNIKNIDKITYYCKKCYKNNRTLINNLINNNASEEEILKLKIKIHETEEEINKKKILKEQEELEKKEFEEFQKRLIKYKDEILTNNAIKKIEKNKNFCLGELLFMNTKYKCPICKTIENFQDINRCEKCERFICSSNCSEEKFESCPDKNCYYCNKGSCNNNSVIFYCKDCFVDYNKEFYNKNKNKVITNEILELEEIDLDDFSNNNYDLKFNCHLCENIFNFNNEYISCCDRCDKYVCKECGFHKYVECGMPFCIYCLNKSCWNGENYFFCDECVDEMGSYEDDTESDEEKKEEIKIKPRCTSPVELSTNKTEECNICYVNKKNYACVPCGHLCMCGDCANKVDSKCPICNVKFTNVIKIFT